MVADMAEVDAIAVATISSLFIGIVTGVVIMTGTIGIDKDF